MLILFSSCGKSEAERMGIKWCECNMQKAELFKELDQAKDPAKIGVLISNIMLEEQNAVDCMGGAEKLKALEEKLSNTEKGEFQSVYDNIRKDLCPETIKLLKKRDAKKVQALEPSPKSEKSDSTTISDSLSTENTDSLSTEEE
jgi:hypothetical protein